MCSFSGLRPIFFGACSSHSFLLIVLSFEFITLLNIKSVLIMIIIINHIEILVNQNFLIFQYFFFVINLLNFSLWTLALLDFWWLKSLYAFLFLNLYIFSSLFYLWLVFLFTDWNVSSSII